MRHQSGLEYQVPLISDPVFDTNALRSAGIVYDSFDMGSLIEARNRLLGISDPSGSYSTAPIFSVAIRTRPELLMMQLNGTNSSVPLIQQPTKSALHQLLLSPNGTFLIPTSTECQRTTIVALRQASLPQLPSAPTMVQGNLILGDSLPRAAMLGRVRLLFPALVQERESLAVSCEISESLRSHVKFVGDSSLVVTRDQMVSALYSNAMQYVTQRFPYGVDIAVSGSFDRNTFNVAPLLYGSLRCRVEALVPVSRPGGSRAVIPSYMTQVLSVGIVWLGSAWGMFSDILIESDARIGSIWTSPNKWMRIGDLLSSMCAVGPPSDLCINATLHDSSIAFWDLDDTARALVISNVTRSPLVKKPFSLPLSAAGINITLIADSGFWMTPSISSADLSGFYNEGPYSYDTQVTVAGTICPVSWVSQDGRSIRVFVPSFGGLCSAGNRKTGINCDSMSIVVSTGGLPDGAVAALTIADGGIAIRQLQSRRLARKLLLQSPLDSLAVSRLPVTFSCPPFCPGGVAQALEPYISGETWAARNLSAAAKFSSSEASLPDEDIGISDFGNVFVAQTCTHLGFEPLPNGTDIYSGPCMNESSGALCAYVQDGLCNPCPQGALCPGNAYILPRRGYRSARFPTDPNIQKCVAPSDTRCLGFNITTFSQPCGKGYTDSSCSSCVRGFYASFDDATATWVCLDCIVWRKDRYIPVIIFLLVLAALGLIISLLSWAITREFGGSVIGSVKRSGKFILFLFVCTQYLVQVGRATKTAGVARAFRFMLASLEALQFSALAAPSACLHGSPFSTEMTQMGLVMATMCMLCISILALAQATKLARIYQYIRCSSCSNRCMHMQDRASVKYLRSVWMVFTDPSMYGRSASIILSIIFALTCNVCLGVIACDDEKPIRVSTYLTLSNDGSALHRAGLLYECSPGNPSCSSDGSAVKSLSVLRQMIPVSVVTKYPGFVCGEAGHKKARAFAMVTLVFLGALYPASSGLFLYARLRHVMHQAFGDAEGSKGGSIVRRPCAHWRRSWCVRPFATAACMPPCRKPSKKLVPNSDDDYSVTYSKKPNGNPRAELSQTHRPRTRSLLLVDTPPCIAAADNDKYFNVLSNQEFSPSSFYFMQLNHIVAFLLSLSLAYLGGRADAWKRLAFNSAIILGYLCLIFTTKPYRKEERFGAHVQISILLVSYLVTITGFAGSFSSVSSGVAPAGSFLGIATGGSAISGSNSSSIITIANNSSAVVGNNTGAWPSTGLIPAIPSSVLERVTVALSYITLVVMGIVAIYLVASFVQALKLGAILERQTSSRSLIEKMEIGMITSFFRSVGSSLRMLCRRFPPSLRKAANASEGNAGGAHNPIRQGVANPIAPANGGGRIRAQNLPVSTFQHPLNATGDLRESSLSGDFGSLISGRQPRSRISIPDINRFAPTKVRARLAAKKDDELEA
jgi:hypothetical protein